MNTSQDLITMPTSCLRTVLTTVFLAAAGSWLPANIAQAQAEEPGPNLGRLSVDLGIDWTSAYFFRGYLQEDSGMIVQPWAEIGFALADGDGQSPSVSATLGVWNSLHSEHTGSTDIGKDIWYESDFYGGLSFEWDTLELGIAYTVYTYPNSDFNTVQEVGLTLGIDLPDDGIGKWTGDLALGLYMEVDNSNVHTEEASYVQIDFGPSFDVFDGAATMSIPVSIGLSLDDYYVGTDDEDFGYLSVGAALECPLGAGAFGESTLTGGIHFLVLGDTTEAANNDDSSDVYAHIGVALSF